MERLSPSLGMIFKKWVKTLIRCQLPLCNGYFFQLQFSFHIFMYLGSSKMLSDIPVCIFELRKRKKMFDILILNNCSCNKPIMLHCLWYIRCLYISYVHYSYPSFFPLSFPFPLTLPPLCFCLLFAWLLSHAWDCSPEFSVLMTDTFCSARR